MNKKSKIILAIGILIVLIIVIICIAFAIRKSSKTNEQISEENDTTPPIIILGDTYTVKTGYEKNLVDVIVSADDMDPDPKKEIIGSYDLNTEGEYPLTFKVEDSSGNITTKDFILKVKNEVSSTYKEEELSFEDAKLRYKTDDTKLGIDVSKWQGDIEWQKVKASGIEFAILRMGYQNGFDGDVLIDPYFESNIKGCIENDIPIAVYFSSYSKTSEESKAQAEWICQKLKEYNYSNISISYDWENWTSFNKLKMCLNDLNSMADTFMDECVSQGYKSMLYGSKTYLESFWKNSKNYPVWLANYVQKTTYENQYKIWQCSQKGTISGINGYVDINVMY